MELSLEKALVEVWRHVLIEHAKVVVMSTERYPARLVLKRSLRRMDFEFEGNEILGLEQDPETKSQWVQLGGQARRWCNPSATDDVWRMSSGRKGDSVRQVSPRDFERGKRRIGEE